MRQITTQRQLQSEAQPLLPRKGEKAKFRLKLASNPAFDKDNDPCPNVRFTDVIADEANRARRAEIFNCIDNRIELKPLGFVDWETKKVKVLAHYEDPESAEVITDEIVALRMTIAKRKSKSIHSQIMSDLKQRWESITIKERCWAVLGWGILPWMPQSIPQAWKAPKYIPAAARRAYSL